MDKTAEIYGIRSVIEAIKMSARTGKVIRPKKFLG